MVCLITMYDCTLGRCPTVPNKHIRTRVRHVDAHGASKHPASRGQDSSMNRGDSSSALIHRIGNRCKETMGCSTQPTNLPDSDPIKLVIDQPIGQQLFSPGRPAMHVNSPQILPSGRRTSSSVPLFTRTRHGSTFPDRQEQVATRSYRKLP